MSARGHECPLVSDSTHKQTISWYRAVRHCFSTEGNIMQKPKFLNRLQAVDFAAAGVASHMCGLGMWGMLVMGWHLTHLI